MNPIKLSDFARQQGVTPRAVQQLLKKYECEIEGHFERKGQNGTWLDGTAQDFLRSKMLQKPIVTYDATAQPLLEEKESLKTKVSELQESLAAAYKALADEKEKMNAVQLKIQNSMVQLQLLEAAKGEAEDRVAALADENKTLTRENTLLIQKKLDVELQLKATEEDLKTAEDVAEATGQELEKTKAALEQEISRPITLKEFFQRRKRR